MGKFDRHAQVQFTEERDQQILCVGIILLTIGKSVNPDNYDGWIKNRIRTFFGALGIPEDVYLETKSVSTTGIISQELFIFVSLIHIETTFISDLCISS